MNLRGEDHQAVYGYLAELEQGVDRSAGASGAPAGSNLGYAWSGGPSYVDAFGARRSPTPPQLVEAYKSIIYFCVELNAKRVQRVPLRLYAASGGGIARPRSLCLPRPLSRSLDRHVRAKEWLPRSLASAERIEEVTSHPFLDLLDRPEPFGYFNRRSLIGLVCRYLDVTGTAYLKPFGLGDGFPEELWPLQSQYVLAFNRGSTALIEKYQYFTESYPFDELIRFRWESLRNPYGAGYGPTQAAVQYAELEDEFVSIQRQILDAGPRPGMIVSSANPQLPIGPDEAKQLEQNLNRKFSRGAAARVWVQSVPLNAQTVTYPPSDLGGLQIADYDLERTCNIFGVPPVLVSKETNLANMEAAHRRHAEDAVEPRCDLIAAELTSLVRRYDPRLFVCFDAVLREEEESRAKVHQIYLQSYVLSVDEVRQEIGFEPAPWGGTEPYGDGKLKTPSSAAEDRENAKALAAAMPKPGNPAKDKPEKGTDSTEVEEDAAEQRSLLAQAAKVLGQVEEELKRHAG